MIKFIFSIIILTISVAFMFTYVKPEYNRTQESLAEIKRLNVTLRATENIKGIVKQIGDSLRGIDPLDTARSKVFLPEKIDEIRFANNLQNIGTINGIILTDIRVVGVDKKVEKVTTSGVANTSGKLFPASRPGGSLLTDKAVDINMQKTADTANLKKYVTTKASFSFITTYGKSIVFLSDLEKSLGIISITDLSFQEHVGGSKASNIANIQKNILLYKYIVEIETYSLK